jgi:ferric-dicitrate binding protein FerR (iron transport regulator)
MDQLFRKYLNSVLNPEEYSKVSDFLADKNNEAIIYSLIKPFWDKAMQEDNQVSAPNPELRNKILHAVLIDERKTAQRKLAANNMILRIAAILVVGLIISTVFFFHKSWKDQYAPEMQTVSAPYGAKTSFSLPDGSLVWLNSGSTVSFVSSFEKARLVKLKGEAFFEVTKNGKPFIVLTEYGEVEVKGTTFNVTAFAGEKFQTTLLTGIVNVTEKLTGKSVSIKPGQQAGINGTALEVKNVDTEMFSSWKDGKLIFRNEYLPSVTKRLERWYNVKIDLADDKRLSEISYTGVLEMESFSEVLQLLKVTAPIDYLYNEKTRTIRIEYKKKV